MNKTQIIKNTVGEQFYTREEAKLFKKAFANQPGIFSGQRYKYDKSFIAGIDEANAKFVEMAKSDATAIGLNFQEYKEGMSGGYAVLLVVRPNKDYHWYRQDADGTWSHKPGSWEVITGVVDPVADARERRYTSIVGYYYITEVCNND